jgi:hypothetical protein
MIVFVAEIESGFALSISGGVPCEYSPEEAIARLAQFYQHGWTVIYR